MEEWIKTRIDFHFLEIKRLNGYDNANYLMNTEEGKFILKTYPYSLDTFDLVQAETDILLVLQQKFEGRIPTPVPFLSGNHVDVVEVNGKSQIIRLLSFLEGSFLGNTKTEKEQYYSLGNFLGELDKELSRLKNYPIQSRKWEWHIQYPEFIRDYLEDIPSAKDISLVQYFLQQFEENVRPILPSLRKSIIYNDANEWNILLKENKDLALIDFGDLAYAPFLQELAVAMTYAAYDKDNYLEWGVEVLKGYQSVISLEEKELEALYYLIAARLCSSVCNSAHARKTNPENAYASVSEENAWKMLYGWLKINPIEAENRFREVAGLPKKKVLSLEDSLIYRNQYLSSILSVSYNNPIKMERAAFQYMYDAYGNTFLDAYNNIPHVGHSHPKVVEAGQRQMAKLNTNTRYLYDLLPEYAEKLFAKFPSSLNRVFFVNSGSAASDLAVRMAKWHTQREGIAVVEHGYHGNTQISIDISDYKFNNPKGQGKKENILKVPIPDAYRGKYAGESEKSGMAYAKEAKGLINNFQMPIAAFIAEPIVGCGGQIPLAPGYLREVYAAVRAQGGLCISDEVQTGFGRVGDYFWGFEQHAVVPDMVILGKPMGNGHPMGAVVCNQEVAESFEKGVEFFSSFGGNPVSCAIGLAVLEVMEEEGLQENAKVVGNYYKSLFLELQKNHDCIGDVRGSGLFLGVDLVKPGTKEEDPLLAKTIKNKLREQFILISTDGPKDSVLKTKPPLIFTKENALQVVEEMSKALSKNQK
ncbi:hydroxylysine kinase /5-phosphonooxy-L-lysine phospho-lyase apoenzyme [Aquiflexum balticum DSM 16537]|uniref:Hydroxylysine kinase /5-phosphonooxy-L-lysine phospho-lyase apoenzyme n=1 Tax=Aquiflexum balticum DSM 16537 TaxID=758820 RepID=A0A1W2H2W6_9BACT|nr:aminotransferase class III-fold pyridoxal phosphate-dependent enzyme [Aquiflexum balticum]SMD42958.1 hydroxylysine kinase /5-phosphonooxy-L-lysine phospho-lyase apoenzyme [Aquiflexum balticum DSM 16537]